MSRPHDSRSATTPGSDPGDGVLLRWEPVIGLEVHCQLKTETKLFCGCSTRFGAQPNHHTCPVCLGLPGVLPVLNEKAVDYAVMMALALGGKVSPVSVFARKQYFYPDLPKGYQISQYDLPYCVGGEVRLASGKVIRLTRIHIEEDAGKNVHAGDASYVDINRAGTPLIEIVSEPDLRSADEATEYLKRLHALVRHLDISDGNMDEGSFRCDANVSLRPRGETRLGTRCEIKNVNSFRSVERAIWYEIHRQAEVLESGGKISQQTVQFDAETGKTSPMRSKEESHDYRYVPDPDLGPLRLEPARVARLLALLPELPEAMAARFHEAYGLSAYDGALLTSDKDLAAYFESVVRETQGAVTPKVVANWVTSEFLREVNERGWSLASPPLSAADLGAMLRLLGDGTISGKIAKTVFEEMVETGAKPGEIVEKSGLVQVQDEGVVRAVVVKVLAANPGQLQQYRGGKDKLFGFFVGQVMKEGQGKLNPALANRILKEELDRTP